MFANELLPDDQKAARFGRALIEELISTGFGARTKRELELLVIDMLQHANDAVERQTDFDLAVGLKTNKRKIRALRDELSYRKPLSEARRRILLRDALRQPTIVFDKGQVRLQLDDAMLRGFAEQLIRRNEAGVVDRSFNTAIMTISGEQYIALAFEVLEPSEQKQIREEIEDYLGRVGALETKSAEAMTGSLFRRFAESVVEGAGAEAGRLLVAGGLALATGGASILLSNNTIQQSTRGLGGLIARLVERTGFKRAVAAQPAV